MQQTLIALFPLQVFLLPGEKIKLHIFEKRYQQLIIDCKQEDQVFGIPYIENGKLKPIGCFVRVSRIIAQYPGGASDIEIEAIDLFRVNKFYPKFPEKLYPGGDVTVVKKSDNAPISPRLISAFDRFMSKQGKLIQKSLLSPGANILDAAGLLELSQLDKIKLVTANSTPRQEAILINFLKLQTKLLDQENSVKGKVFLN